MNISSTILKDNGKEALEGKGGWLDLNLQVAASEHTSTGASYLAA